MRMNDKNHFKKIPSVNLLLQSEQGQKLVNDYSQEVVTQAIRIAIDKFRMGDLAEFSDGEQFHAQLLDVAEAFLHEKFEPSLKRVINATGTVIHTNLGRAKLSPYIKDVLIHSGLFFTNVEYDIKKGERGSRYQHLEEILCELTGAEAALVVNNNAAAVMLVLRTLANEKEVIVSRGELVEIGGSFRIPEIIALSGCQLKEVEVRS